MLQPIGDRVIVKVKDEEEEKVGGIVLASNAKEKPQMGEIIAVGSQDNASNFFFFFVFYFNDHAITNWL